MKKIIILIITMIFSKNIQANLQDYKCIYDKHNYVLSDGSSNLFVNNLKEKSIEFNSFKKGDFGSFPEKDKSKTQDIKKLCINNQKYFHKFKLCFK
jgi:hypothetical protein